MAISIDHHAATEVLHSESAAAIGDPHDVLVRQWRDRVESLGRLCPPRKSATTIAALGTALLAKAINISVDAFSLLERGDEANSYSARSLADGVWAPNRAQLEIDLGANGPNPLNNTPFIGKASIRDIAGVRNQTGWAAFIKCIEAANLLASEEDARHALRGFILARRKSLLPARPIDPQLGDHLSPTRLGRLLDAWVAQESEGGRRAQACAAGILDAGYGPQQVFVGKINDPDRRSPLDVAVQDLDGKWLFAAEVKDKPLTDAAIHSSIEKTARDHEVNRILFLAMSDQQGGARFDDAITWAAERGTLCTVYLSWLEFILSCRSLSLRPATFFEGAALRRILSRAGDYRVDTRLLTAPGVRTAQSTLRISQ